MSVPNSRASRRMVSAGHAGQGLRPFRRLHDAVREAEEIRAVRRARRGAPSGRWASSKPSDEPVEEGLVVQALADDDLRHRDQHGRVGARADRRRARRPSCRLVRVARGSTADDADAALVGPVQVLRVVRAEGAVGGAPAPEDHEPRVDVVGRARGPRTCSPPWDRRCGGGRRSRPRSTDSTRARCSRRTGAGGAGWRRGCAARPCCPSASSRGWRRGRTPRGCAASGRRPRRAPRPTRCAPDCARALRSHAAHRVAQAVGVVDAIRGAEAARAGRERRQLGRPLARVRADAHDLRRP